MGPETAVAYAEMAAVAPGELLAIRCAVIFVWKGRSLDAVCTVVSAGRGDCAVGRGGVGGREARGNWKMEGIASVCVCMEWIRLRLEVSWDI